MNGSRAGAAGSERVSFKSRTPCGKCSPLLRNNEEIGILLDQNVQEKDGVYVPLFGKAASTSAGLAAIVMKTKCPVIAAFILPDGKKGQYVIQMSPPIRFEESGNRGKKTWLPTPPYTTGTWKRLSGSFLRDGFGGTAGLKTSLTVLILMNR